MAIICVAMLGNSPVWSYHRDFDGCSHELVGNRINNFVWGNYKDAKTFEPLAPVETVGGKTCALDLKSHNLYVVSGPPGDEKGTVKVLLLAPK